MATHIRIMNKTAPRSGRDFRPKTAFYRPPAPSRRGRARIPGAAGSGAYKTTRTTPVGRLPSAGGPGAAHARDSSHSPGSGDPAYKTTRTTPVGRLPSAGGPPRTETTHEFTRLKRSWRWQDGFHDHKFRTPESEQRKWEYVCLNPVRYGLVERPEQWPFGGEIFYEETSGPRLVPGTPPLLEVGILMSEDGRTVGGGNPPANPPARPLGEDSRPAT